MFYLKYEGLSLFIFEHIVPGLLVGFTHTACQDMNPRPDLKKKTLPKLKQSKLLLQIDTGV